MYQGQNFLWQQRQQLQLQQMQRQLAMQQQQQQQRAAERRQQQQQQEQRKPQMQQVQQVQRQQQQQQQTASPQRQQQTASPQRQQQQQQQQQVSSPPQQKVKPPASPVHPVGAPGARGLHVGLQSPPPAPGSRSHRPFARSKTATAPLSTGERSAYDAAVESARRGDTATEGSSAGEEETAAGDAQSASPLPESPADSPLLVASSAGSPQLASSSGGSPVVVASTSSELPEVHANDAPSAVTQQTSQTSFRRPSLAELSPGASPHTTEWSAYRLGTRNFNDESPSPGSGVSSGHRPPLPLMHSRLKPHGGIYDPTGSHVQRPETSPSGNAPRVHGYDSGILAARVKQLEDEIVHLRRELQDEKVTSAVVIQNQQQDILRMQQLIDQCVGPCRNLLDMAARVHDRLR